ncbi:MAG TPA: flagellar hook-length control protein FliK [Rhizomicrobium sp.]|nr:flagellar hook-length control protein FliK [Rhizomicrobium sp.]
MPAPSATALGPAQPDMAKQAKPDVVMDAKSFARLAPFIMPTLAAKQAAAIPATPASDPSDTDLNSIEQLASKALAASQPRTNTAKAPSISVFDAIEGMRAAILPDRGDIVRPSDSVAMAETPSAQSAVVMQAALAKQSAPPQSSDTKTTTPYIAPQFAAQIFVPAFAEPQAVQPPNETRVDAQPVPQSTQIPAPKQTITQAPTSGIKAAIQTIASKPFTRQPIQTVLETLAEAVASSNDSEQATPATSAAPAAANIPKSPQLTAQTSVQKFNDALAAKQIVAPVIASMLGDQASLSAVASRAAQAAAQTLGKTPSNAKPQTSSQTSTSTVSRTPVASAPNPTASRAPAPQSNVASTVKDSVTTIAIAAMQAATSQTPIAASSAGTPTPPASQTRAPTASQTPAPQSDVTSATKDSVTANAVAAMQSAVSQAPVASSQPSAPSPKVSQTSSAVSQTSAKASSKSSAKNTKTDTSARGSLAAALAAAAAAKGIVLPAATTDVQNTPTAPVSDEDQSDMSVSDATAQPQTPVTNAVAAQMQSNASTAQANDARQQSVEAKLPADASAVQTNNASPKQIIDTLSQANKNIAPAPLNDSAHLQTSDVPQTVKQISTHSPQAANNAPQATTNNTQQPQVQQPVQPTQPQQPQMPVTLAGDPATAQITQAAQAQQTAQPHAAPVSVALQVAPHIVAHAQASDISAFALSIAARSEGSTKHFDIRLDPADLGRIDVKLSIDESGKASAHLSAEKPQTLELLQRDAPTLTRTLKDSGLDLSQNGLNFSLKGQNQQNGNGNSPAPRGTPLNVTAIATPEPTTNPLNLKADNVRLDIRV